MIKSFMAEMDKAIRRPATWVLVVVWAIAAVAFVYISPFIKYAAPTSTVSATSRQALLTGMLPAQLIPGVIAGFPIFGGAIALIFGALVTGSEYGWGTFKTLLMQRADRLSVLSGKLLALAVMQFAFVLALFASGAVSSFIVATLTHSPVRWPSAEDFAQGLGAAW
jgi:ABC-type transport system involved in multi-copper enzyme maturation permease subunit